MLTRPVRSPVRPGPSAVSTWCFFALSVLWILSRFQGLLVGQHCLHQHMILAGLPPSRSLPISSAALPGLSETSAALHDRATSAGDPTHPKPYEFIRFAECCPLIGLPVFLCGSSAFLSGAGGSPFGGRFRSGGPPFRSDPPQRRARTSVRSGVSRPAPVAFASSPQHFALTEPRSYE